MKVLLMFTLLALTLLGGCSSMPEARADCTHMHPDTQLCHTNATKY